MSGQEGQVHKTDSILLVYQRTRSKVQRACALSGIERHPDYKYDRPMQAFCSRLSRLTNEQQRAYWHGYLDP